MSKLELKFLGPTEIVRDGEALTLPPSRKTRALLAYLVMNPRPFRREHLCELLWEIPDDPRGALRWSLSKLRRLVDAPGRRRIVADRATVAFDAAGVEVDALDLQACDARELEGKALRELEGVAARYRGEFLEGLELGNFHDFHAWCVAERERSAGAQARVLRALIARLGEDSEQALVHARALVSVEPYDEAARALLIARLVRAGHAREAEQQYLLGMRMLDEIGVESSGALHRAWRGAGRGKVDDTVTPTRAVRAVEHSATLTRQNQRLIGRDAELKRLEDAVHDATATRSARFVLLKGEPGIGKTRLLEAVTDAARAGGSFVLQASSFEVEAMRPFGPWIDALRAHGSEPSVQGALSLLTDRGGDGRAPDINRERLFDALSDLVGSQAARQPVMIAFDDLQWSDESSTAVLHYVARMNRDLPLFVVLSAREGELRDNAFALKVLRALRHDQLLEEMTLGPLSQAATRQLIGTAVPGADAQRLGRESGGNPLFAIELARAEDTGEIEHTSLADVIRERMSRLDAEATYVLRWASVLGPAFQIAALHRISGIERVAIERALEAGERSAIVVAAEQGYRFPHDLVRSAIYVDISAARRRVMHERIAAMLEESVATDLGVATELAHHAALAGDGAIAVRALIAAARLCLRFYDNDRAYSLAEKGLEQAKRLDERERVCATLDLWDIRLAARPMDDWEEAATTLVDLAEHALDLGAMSHARLGYHLVSYLRWQHGQWQGAREDMLQAERISRGGTDAEHIIAKAEAAKCLAMLERDLSIADAMLMEAQALARREHLDIAAIPAASGMLRFHEGRLEEAQALFGEARALSKSAGDRLNEFQANEYLVMIDFERGRIEDALERCAVLEDIGARLREGSEAPFAHALSALCRYALNPNAADDLDPHLEALRQADAKYRLAYILTRAAMLDVGAARLDSALERAREALQHAELLERPTETVLAHLALAQVHRAQGDEAASKRHMAALSSFPCDAAARWARNQVEPLLARELA